MKKYPLLFSMMLVAGLLSSCESASGSAVSASASSTASTQPSVVSSGSDNSLTSSAPDTDIDIYASPDGEGTTADGSIANPYDIYYAIKQLHPGHTIYLLGGTYKLGQTVMINSTTDLYPASSQSDGKTIMPATDSSGSEESVVFDFSQMSFDSSNRGISVNTDFWHIKDFSVVGAGDNGIYIGGNHNIIENMDISACQDTGLQLGRASSSDATMDTWPSYNTVLNCTSHDNHDVTGENADGFACKLTTGVGNLFNGCLSYNNVDDGWDLYTKGESGPIGSVTIENCVAFNNGITSYGVGTANSDGNGFKLGGEGIAVPHKVINCISFDNLASGFTDNSNPGTLSLINCTSYNNGTRDSDKNNYDMCRDENTSINYFKNDLSYCDGYRTNPIDGTSTISNSKDEYKGTASYSVFYYGLSMLSFTSVQACDYLVDGLSGSMFSSSVSPFVSTVSPQTQASKGVDAGSHPDLHHILRKADGSLNLGDFLKISPDSPFYTMGEDGTPIGADLSD